MELTRYRWDECRCSGYNGCGCSYRCGNRGISLGVGGISVRVSSLWGVSIVDRGSVGIDKGCSYTSIIPGDSIMVRSHNGGLGFFRVTNCQNGGENELKIEENSQILLFYKIDFVMKLDGKYNFSDIFFGNSRTFLLCL